MSWKIEFTDKNAVLQNRFWRNGHDDDFLQFLLGRFDIPKENFKSGGDWTIFKLDVNLEDITKLYYSNKHNVIDMSVSGKISMRLKDVARYVEDDYVKLAEFTAAKAAREAIFVDAVTPQTVTVPATIQHDFGSGDEDAKQLPAGNELIAIHESIELEVTGTALTQWSYDDAGKFRGNK